MRIEKITFLIIVRMITDIIDRIIKENAESLATSDFMVRPGYGYDKFYLNWTKGSFDMSLQGLIHHIMFEEGIYNRILTPEQFAECERVVNNDPEAIYSPSGESDDDMESQELLDNIYFRALSHTGKKLLSMGLNVQNDFSEYLTKD